MTSRTPWPLVVTAGVVACLASSEGIVGAQPPPSIPFCPGLTIVTAISQPTGDYESIKTVESVDARSIGLKFSSEWLENGVTRRMTVRRAMLPDDLRSATLYMHHFNNKAATTIPGTTAIGVSSAILRALKASGEARLGIFEAVGVAAPADRNASPNVYDYQMVETIRRVSPTPVSVTVNDTLVALPAIRAQGDYYGDKADFFFLDDERNPLALKYRIGRDTLDVVKISFRCTPEPPTSAPPEGMSTLERQLQETGRARVHTIYFSFNSDRLREESGPTLAEIAAILARHPDWRLAIEGHTDSIASDSYNLDLSRRRAAAVKQSLVTERGVAETRLVADGFGESRPQDTNDTLDGRARNRRVELVRLP